MDSDPRSVHVQSLRQAGDKRRRNVFLFSCVKLWSILPFYCKRYTFKIPLYCSICILLSAVSKCSHKHLHTIFIDILIWWHFPIKEKRKAKDFFKLLFFFLKTGCISFINSHKIYVADSWVNVVNTKTSTIDSSAGKIDFLNL